MSKEPTKSNDDAADTSNRTEGRTHGLTPQQVEKIEAARGDKEPSPKPELAPTSDARQVGADKDDEEDRDVDQKRK